MSSKLLVLLEEAKEMTDENNPVPLIGTCFADLADVSFIPGLGHTCILVEDVGKILVLSIVLFVLCC